MNKVPFVSAKWMDDSLKAQRLLPYVDYEITMKVSKTIFDQKEFFITDRKRINRQLEEIIRFFGGTVVNTAT
jgi:hypothetical protein